MLDVTLALGSLNSIVILTSLVVAALVITRPDKGRFRLIVLCGILCSLIDFIIEAIAIRLGAWGMGAVSSPLAPFGVPLSMSATFVFIGMFVCMMSDLPSILKRRFRALSSVLNARNETFAIAFVAVAASAYFITYDMNAYMAGYWAKASWWNFSYTYMVWLFILGTTVLIYHTLLNRYINK